MVEGARIQHLNDELPNDDVDYVTYWMQQSQRARVNHDRRKWRQSVARQAGRQVIQVESDVVVPVEVATDKGTFAARATGPKLKRRWNEFLDGLSETRLKRYSLPLNKLSKFRGRKEC